MALSAKDKKTLLALTEQAQLVYLLTRYPKKQVLDDAGDVERLETGLDQMRASAKELSAGIREKAGAVPWDELAKKPDTPDLAWRRAKRVAPTVLRELMPLLEGEPEAAFFLRPEATPAKTKQTAVKNTGAKKTTAERAAKTNSEARHTTQGMRPGNGRPTGGR